ncbi:MAG TPA: DUF2917 domain-containing protein [Burkholderiales bacterium]|nr:DUF2917 domain-containing protein [Burkholderiales bacterium]
MDSRTWKEPVDDRIVAEGLFLEHRAMLCIARGTGLLVSSHTGTLWITQEGKRDDIVLTAGEWHRLESDALAIASALGATIVTISAPLAAAARWEIQRVSAEGVREEVRSRTRGNRFVRTLQAWVLGRYRSGAQAARRMQQFARDAALRDGVERLVAQLDARTRRDIGLGEIPGGAPAERAERYRWRQEFSWPARESTFI